MSYDIDLKIDTGAGEYLHIEVGNHTSNCSCMWNDALPGDMTVRKMHGMSAGVAGELLREAVDKMESNPGKYQAMNPPNGWGDYESALEFLTKFKRMCLQHPACVVDVFV